MTALAHELERTRNGATVMERTLEAAKIEIVRLREELAIAHHTGRNAGLEEAARIPRAYAEELDKGIFGKRFPHELTHIFNASTNMAYRIRAMKFDLKGGS